MLTVLKNFLKEISLKTFRIYIGIASAMFTFGAFAMVHDNKSQNPDAGISKCQIEAPYVMLQGLDKITARVLTIDAAIGDTVHFGTLQIKVLRCLKSPPEEPPESMAFIEIQEEKPNIPLHIVFSGWIFSKNPSISAPEHPVYDIWVKECTDKPATPSAALSSKNKSAVFFDPNLPAAPLSAEDVENDIMEDIPIAPPSTQDLQANPLPTP